MAPVTRRGQNTPPNNTNPNNMTLESVQAMIDQALLQNSTNGDGSLRTEGIVGLTQWIEKWNWFSKSVVVLLKMRLSLMFLRTGSTTLSKGLQILEAV
nr:hypothetical protein [Tanacetum cinerariifolium]